MVQKKDFIEFDIDNNSKDIIAMEDKITNLRERIKKKKAKNRKLKKEL